LKKPGLGEPGFPFLQAVPEGVPPDDLPFNEKKLQEFQCSFRLNSFGFSV
jgi:hypothetical protein